MACPDCGGIIAVLEGCELCISCGWSPCFSAHPFSGDSCAASLDLSRLDEA